MQPMSHLFFALWPDDTVGLELARYRIDLARACEGRAVSSDTLHLTLVFIGEVPETRVAELAGCADRVTARLFDLVVDTAGCFKRAQIGWLGCSQPPAALFDLQLALRSEVAQAGFGLDPRKFKPHVTGVRNISFPVKRQKLPGINWPVRSFNLIESVQTESGTVYKILGTWKLSKPPLT
jgi:2'-5' RNA ligase